MHDISGIAVASSLAVAGAEERANHDELETRLTPAQVVLSAVCCGLAAGLLELLILCFRVQAFEQGFFLRSEHFLWIVPLSDVVIYGSVGLALALWQWSGRPLTAALYGWHPALRDLHERASHGPRAESADMRVAIVGDRAADGWLGSSSSVAIAAACPWRELSSSRSS